MTNTGESRGDTEVVSVRARGARYQLTVLLEDHIGRQIRDTGRAYERHLISAVSRLAKPPATIVDVGANIGNHSIYWALRGHQVVAFEPNPQAIHEFQKNIALNRVEQRVNLRTVALGDVRTRGRLHKGSQGNVGSARVVADESGDTEIQRLDDQRLPTFRAIKIDVEGFEEQVLRGAAESIANMRPIIVIEQGASGGGADAWLRKAGYRRVPISLAATPTFIYAPNVRVFLRSLTVFEVIGKSVARVLLPRNWQWRRRRRNSAAEGA
jgi:FkbM family methyltransferase